MDHLKVLSILDFVSAGLSILAMLLVGLSTAATIGLAVTSGGGSEVWTAMLPALVINGLVLVFLGVLAVIEILAGLRVRDGRGRILQTVVAVLSLLNCPLGTLFAGYSLWVCWIDEASKARFEQTPEA